MRVADAYRTSDTLRLRKPFVVSQPQLRRAVGPERVERAQRGADDRRRVDHDQRVRHVDALEALVDRREQQLVPRLQQAAAENDVRRLRHRRDPLERDPYEGDDLAGEPANDALRDDVARGLGEHDRRELDEAALRDGAGVDGLGKLERRRDAEVLGDELLEGRLRPAPVLRPGRGPDGGEPDVLSPAPVAGDLAERGEAGLPAVRAEAEAVDPRAAHDRDAPAAVGARPQHGKGVVRDLDALGPPALLRAGLQRLHLGREVDAGEQQLGVVDRPVGAGLDHERLDAVERAVEPVLVRRAARAADEREHVAVAVEEREVGLRIAAVDREQQAAHLTVSAASTVSRSYAATCWTSPSSSGARVACSSGCTPAAPTRAGTSTTSSAASPRSVPLLRVSTTWTAPSSVASERTRPTAASL